MDTYKNVISSSRNLWGDVVVDVVFLVVYVVMKVRTDRRIWIVWSCVVYEVDNKIFLLSFFPLYLLPSFLPSFFSPFLLLSFPSFFFPFFLSSFYNSFSDVKLYFITYSLYFSMNNFVYCCWFWWIFIHVMIFSICVVLLTLEFQTFLIWA